MDYNSIVLIQNCEFIKGWIGRYFDHVCLQALLVSLSKGPVDIKSRNCISILA